MRNNETPIAIERSSYQQPSHWISSVHLTFDLEPSDTTVTAQLAFEANPQRESGLPMRLEGESLELVKIEIDGQALAASAYTLDDKGLTIHQPPVRGMLHTVVRIKPDTNTRLEGLYVSSGNFFTQCEAEGFRRITFFPDRPDVMARYTVVLRADKARFPVLLGNGNLIGSRELDNGYHEATWEDPFPKPCYLFALVAGTLVCEERTITRASGKPALLQVWVESGNLDKTSHAMESLVKSIEWDERRFGLELDLDRFMIVAVGDFNMGAMENKGLNIFNTKFVLANPDVATDIDYDNIESVVGHEYFHNWTGNRVTCRDWFQLSLKEGLTVFRDQEFSADMMAQGLSAQAAQSARAVKRIEDVKVLRAAQFPEDSGPMAHPIRPDSYVEINNFYTVTVYEKGAEVVRMQHTLLGEQGFRRGMDLYFARHDGQAVTCDDFVDAMEAALQELAPEKNLAQFRRWYSQAGTPRVQCHGVYDAQACTYTLTLTQSCPPTPGQTTKAPFHIPFAIGLIGPEGQDLPLQLVGESQPNGTTRVLDFIEPSQSFVFEGIDAVPVPSLLRGFSAPVIVEAEQTLDTLVFLLRHDSDAFNRWEAGQRLFARVLLDAIHAHSTVLNAVSVAVVTHAVKDLLTDAGISDAYKALILQLPSETTLAEQVQGLVDPILIHQTRQALKQHLASALQSQWSTLVQQLVSKQPYSPDPLSVGRRSLRNLAIAMLCEVGDFAAAQQQFEEAGNMTDSMSALTCLVHTNAPTAPQALSTFENRWTSEALVMDKWFTVQASAPNKVGKDTLSTAKALLAHPQFSWKTPNRVRSVVSTFCHGNPAAFHAVDGSGYRFWAEMVKHLDGINPQVAARLARALDRWTRYTPERQRAMHAALESVAAKETLSPDVSEVIQKALACGTV